MPDRSALRIATWNIHMGIGADGLRDLIRLAGVIRSLQVDCIALQEVDNIFDSPATEELSHLAQESGFESISGPTMHRPDGNYGNALLTRLPIRQVRLLDLSVPGCEPRGLIDADLSFGDGTLRVAATHLGLRPGERRRQVRQLRRHLSGGPQGPTVLLGDFNEWWPWSRVLWWLGKGFAAAPAAATFSSRWPVVALDRIFFTPPLRLRLLQVPKTREVRAASDHLPLVATIRLPD